MNKLNDKVCQVLGILENFDCAFKPWCKQGDKKICVSECDSSQLKRYPDLTEQIIVDCKECDGKGTKDPVMDFEPCCDCQGDKVRKITRLQSILEERGEWGALCGQILASNNEESYMNDFNTIADANALLRAYAGFKEVK